MKKGPPSGKNSAELLGWEDPSVAEEGHKRGVMQVKSSLARGGEKSGDSGNVFATGGGMRYEGEDNISLVTA